ncbi:hypothetical protein BCR43DRAFT_516194 [Syncephalastrum racemosum]|uniref:Endonuclease/exonuclease/phosphatase domain-containing protein n=1 Tax=Syncephalastrum racemosum TaxID=13706 RepID=A0A1X2H7M0_SYNRA|nr:hypothetical protein BCR43DRAFT_516194 [Syncephalastrum racemosum]
MRVDEHGKPIDRNGNPTQRHKAEGGLSFFVRPKFPHHIGQYKLYGLYLPPSLRDRDAAQVYKTLPVDDHTLVLGDLNIRLGPFTGDTRSNTRHTTFHEWLTTQGMTLWNVPLAFGKPTLDGIRGTSIIEFLFQRKINFANPSLTIRDDLPLSSYHFLCEFEFEMTSPSPPLPDATAARRQWRLHHLAQPRVVSRPLRCIRITPPPPHLNAPMADEPASPDTIEMLASELNEAIYHGLDNSVGKSKPRPQRLELEHEAGRQDLDVGIHKAQQDSWRTFCDKSSRPNSVNCSRALLISSSGCGFLGIKTAYDSANRLIIWENLRHRVSPALLRLLQNLFDDIHIQFHCSARPTPSSISESPRLYSQPAAEDGSSLSLGRWQTLWPAMLSLLRRIDQVTSEGDFESEPPAGKLL